MKMLKEELFKQYYRSINANFRTERQDNDLEYINLFNKLFELIDIKRPMKFLLKVNIYSFGQWKLNAE